jgi:hypothetical protein
MRDGMRTFITDGLQRSSGESPWFGFIFVALEMGVFALRDDNFLVELQNMCSHIYKLWAANSSPRGQPATVPNVNFALALLNCMLRLVLLHPDVLPLLIAERRAWDLMQTWLHGIERSAEHGWKKALPAVAAAVDPRRPEAADASAAAGTSSSSSGTAATSSSATAASAAGDTQKRHLALLWAGTPVSSLSAKDELVILQELRPSPSLRATVGLQRLARVYDHVGWRFFTEEELAAADARDAADPRQQQQQSQQRQQQSTGASSDDIDDEQAEAMDTDAMENN